MAKLTKISTDDLLAEALRLSRQFPYLIAFELHAESVLVLGVARRAQARRDLLRLSRPGTPTPAGPRRVLHRPGGV